MSNEDIIPDLVEPSRIMVPDALAGTASTFFKEGSSVSRIPRLLDHSPDPHCFFPPKRPRERARDSCRISRRMSASNSPYSAASLSSRAEYRNTSGDGSALVVVSAGLPGKLHGSQHGFLEFRQLRV